MVKYSKSFCPGWICRTPQWPRRQGLSRGVIMLAAVVDSRGTSSGEANKTLTDRIVAEEAQYVLQTYARPSDVVFTHGAGTAIYDARGREYLDFTAGIAVNCLGHSDPRWVAAVTEQAGKLAHTSNLFHTAPQVDLARRLITTSFADKVFFCNSGTEATEAAIKFARKFARLQAGADAQDQDAVVPTEIVTFTNSFHGRTMGALALTAKEQYQTPFLPVMPGAKQAVFGDLDSAAAVVQTGRTCAIFVEPVQGEGGVHPATGDFLRGLRALADKAGALLVFDEVQCGLGRTGQLWAYEHFGVEPDLLTAAKPLAGGLPIGAVLLTQRVADAMAPGDHGSTFAGNPLVCAAANATFDIVSDPGFLSEVERKGELLCSMLRNALSDNSHVKEVRGSGLLVGIQLDMPAADVVGLARKKGVLVITAGQGDVIRLAPPLTCTDESIATVVAVVTECLNTM